MGPGIALYLPQWPPPQLRALKARFAGLADSFGVGTTHGEGDTWHLVFDDGPEPYEVAVSFRPHSEEEDPAYAAAFGWAPRGYAELYGFRSADMPRSVRTLARLAGEIAERLGGVVALEKAGPVAPLAPGREFEVELGWEAYAGGQPYDAVRPSGRKRRRRMRLDRAYYADAVRYAWVQGQPGYEMSGYPAV